MTHRSLDVFPRGEIPPQSDLPAHHLQVQGALYPTHAFTVVDAVSTSALHESNRFGNDRAVLETFLGLPVVVPLPLVQLEARIHPRLGLFREPFLHAAILPLRTAPVDIGILPARRLAKRFLDLLSELQRNCDGLVSMYHLYSAHLGSIATLTGVRGLIRMFVDRIRDHRRRRETGRTNAILL